MSDFEVYTVTANELRIRHGLPPIRSLTGKVIPKMATERLTITRLKDGGFVVGDPSLRTHYGDCVSPAFDYAATTIDKALEYVKEKLTPPKVKAAK